VAGVICVYSHENVSGSEVMIGLEFVIETFEVKRKELATILGVSQPTIQDWIKGRRAIPEQRLDQLVEYFGLPPAYLQEDISILDQIDILLIKFEREFDGEIKTKEEENLYRLQLFMKAIRSNELTLLDMNLTQFEEGKSKLNTTELMSKMIKSGSLEEMLKRNLKEKQKGNNIG
jgi:transcriptional regulator with XRE-family HTH domain